jgi:hypothetical protein
MATTGIYQETKPVTGSNHLVAAIYDATNPLVVLQSFAFPGPYTGQTQLVTFTGLSAIDYIYICWESTTTSPGGTARNQFNFVPSVNSLTIREDLFLTADISPFLASGTNFYGQDASLIGWDWYTERIPQGSQKPGTDFIKTIAGVATTPSDPNADGWKLAISGDLVGPNEKYVIHFYPQISAGAPAIPNLISSSVVLTANTTLVNTDAGKSFILQGASGYFDVTLPDASTVADNKPYFFLSSGGSHINVGINCFSGQQFVFLGGTSKIILAQDEYLTIYKFTFPGPTVKWVIFQISETVKMVGQIVLGYQKTPPNSVWCDGTTYSKSVYVRLWNFINGLASGTIADTSWNNTQTIDGVVYNINHGLFGMATSTFRVPKIYEYGWIRAAGGLNDDNSTRAVGSFQPLQMSLHAHDTMTGDFPGEPNGTGPAKTHGNYNGTASGKTDLTSAPFGVPGAGAAGSALARVGPQNRPDNIALYASILI